MTLFSAKNSKSLRISFVANNIQVTKFDFDMFAGLSNARARQAKERRLPAACPRRGKGRPANGVRKMPVRYFA